jgi:hypothetical protein
MSKPVKQIHLAAHFPGVNNTTVWSDPRSGSHIDFSSFAHPVPGLAVGPGSAGRTGRGMGGMAVPPGRAAECQARVASMDTKPGPSRSPQNRHRTLRRRGRGRV